MAIKVSIRVGLVAVGIQGQIWSPFIVLQAMISGINLNVTRNFVFIFDILRLFINITYIYILLIKLLNRVDKALIMHVKLKTNIGFTRNKELRKTLIKWHY